MKEDKTCKICRKVFTRRNYMQKHMENIHSKRYSCPKCFRFFCGPTEHSCAIENGRFLCYVRDCSLRFSNGMAMRLHIRDCHQKMDEKCVRDITKTKKGLRETIQILCKRINLLNNCFDELRYQVDTIAGFLKSKEFGFEIGEHLTEKIPVSESIISEVKRELESKEEYEDIDFIDEEYEGDEMSNVISEENPRKTSMMPEELNEDKFLVKNCSDIGPPFISPPNMRVQSPAKSSNLKLLQQKSFVLSTFSSASTLTLPVKSTSNFVEQKPAQKISMPRTTTIGSTIITQVPGRLVKFQNQNIDHRPPNTKTAVSKRSPTSSKATKLSKNDFLTPPLFLKINYDSEKSFCETDPKITFHFDTKPPDEV